MHKQRLTTGIIVLAISAIAFMIAQSQLNALAAERESLFGLGGLAQDLSDSLGLTDIEETRSRYVVVRAVSFAGILVGGFLAISTYLQRDKSE